MKFSMAAGSKVEIWAPAFSSKSIIVRDGASRMSSVPGLKERPQMAIFLFFSDGSCSFSFWNKRSFWLVFTF